MYKISYKNLSRLSRKLLTTTVFCLAFSQSTLAAQNATQSISSQPLQAQYTTSNRVIVKFKNSNSLLTNSTSVQSQTDRLLQTTGVNFLHMRQLANGSSLLKIQRNATGKSLENIISALNQDNGVEYAEIDRKMYPMAVPNDSRYNEQWHYFETTGGLNLPGAWDVAQGSGVVVAVIDTGYLPHNDLAANLLQGYDMIFDTAVSQDGDGRDNDATDNGDWAPAGACYAGSPASNSSWHGTHVSGTIAAVSNNNTGVAGVAYNSKILPVRVLGRCGGYTSDIADGIIWAAGGSVSGVPTNTNPAQVLNLSLGGSGSCSITTQNAIDTARSLGATVVVAAGNSNTNASNANPANCNGVVTVAATNRNGGRSYYSNYGSVVDVAAPGGDLTSGSANGILSTLNSGSTTSSTDSYDFYQGTSMATPHVAGAAALLYEVDPSLTPDGIESILKTTSRSFPATCSQCGSGIVDATAAVNAASGVTPPPPTPSNILENAVSVNNLSASTGQSITYTMDVPSGMTSLVFDISGGTGDADLYVKFGAAPTTSDYDCRPYLNGNNESCDINPVQAGTYYIMIQAYSAFSGVSLVGNYDQQTSTGGGISESNLSASRGQWLNFTLDVPSAMSSLSVNISGGSGDADLYVRYGSQPTTRRYDCRPYKNGNTETCNFSNPSAGLWYIRIRAYQSFSGVTLDANYTP